jgi:uncharacterized cupredoxin-like copper-binding protein
MPRLRTPLALGAALGTIILVGASPARRTASTRHASAPRVVTFVAHDFAFAGPDTIPAGLVELRLENQGAQLHHLWLARLDGGRTMRDVMAALHGGAPATWMHDAGGPNVSPPGGATAATLVLAPGTYAVLCLIPGPDGVPHLMKGMVKELVVTPSAEAAALPTADVALSLTDYAFGFSAPLTAGTHVLRIRNNAAQTHELVLVKLADGKSAQDFVAWVEKMDGPPPATPVGGVTGIAPGGENQITVSLTPGRYAIVCFVADAADGKPHVAHGMVQEVAVR